MKHGDWEIETEHGCFASKTRPGEDLEVCADEDGIRVDITEGRGYNRASTSAFVPKEVLLPLLEAAGLVTPRATDTKEKRRT